MTVEESTVENEEKILVEIFLLPRVNSPIEELVTTIGNSERWKDRLDVRVTEVSGWPLAETPYGTFRDNTVVVSGTHIIHGTDYWALNRALEDSSEPIRI